MLDFSTSTLSVGELCTVIPLPTCQALQRMLWNQTAWDQTLALLRVASCEYFDLFAPSLFSM